MYRYQVRYTLPGEDMIYLFLCECDNYEEAEEMLHNEHSDAILVNIEEEERVVQHNALAACVADQRDTPGKDGFEDGDQSGTHAGSRHKDNPRAKPEDA